MCLKMSILCYFNSDLPDPTGPLSSIVPPKAIETANELVKEAESMSSQCGQYNCFTRAVIGEYSTHHGPTKTAKRFTRIFKTQINESIVRSIEKAYRKEVSRKRKIEDDTKVSELPTKKRGRPLLLGEKIDKKVQAYIESIRRSCMSQIEWY